MNYREQHVRAKYEAQGYRVLRGGAPDFCCLKVNDGRIVGVRWVEVKSPADLLSYEQSVWREVAKHLGVPFDVEVIE